MGRWPAIGATAVCSLYGVRCAVALLTIKQFDSLQFAGPAASRAGLSFVHYALCHMSCELFSYSPLCPSSHCDAPMGDLYNRSILTHEVDIIESETARQSYHTSVS